MYNIYMENIFEKRLKQLGIKKQVDASMIVKQASDTLEKELGSRALDYVQVVSYIDGTLKIATSDSAWAQEVQMVSHKLKTPPVKKVVFSRF